VFNWNERGWSTQGRAVFNLEPHEVLERYRDSLDPISGQMSAAAVGVRDEASS
jgi:hypothetical protein